MTLVNGIGGFSGDPAALSPHAPAAEDYEPSSVTFGEETLGRILSIVVTPYTANIDEHPAGGVLVGSGNQRRIVNRKYCTTVEPGRCEVRFLGYPVFGAQDVGMTALLELDVNGHGLSGYAILETWDVEAAVGELVRGRCVFAFTG